MKGVAVWLLLVMAVGCGGRRVEVGAKPVGKVVEVRVPLGLPRVAQGVTREEVALGERLFFDKRLSADGTVACASCHVPEKGFADGRAVSVGVAGKTGKRNAPTVLNAVFNSKQFRDGRAASLEEQVRGPVENPVEMASAPADVERRLSEDAAMRALFETAYGKASGSASPVTMERVERAIAAYERTQVSGGSAWDRYRFGGEKAALGDAAMRGWAVFRDPAKGNCVACHVVGEREALFTDGLFHNLGVGMDAEGELKDLGRYEVTKREADRGAFRTPGLRGVGKTAPYMHDGSLKTLKEVVDYYVGGGNGNPWLDKRMKPLTHLTGQERADLVAFLEGL